jgi:hypothetical protein
MRFLGELWRFLRLRNKFSVLPIIMTLALGGILVRSTSR